VARDYNRAGAMAAISSVLVTSPSLIARETGWIAQYGSLKQLIETTLNRRKLHPGGYG
jgi:hypothetical protein